MSYKKKKQSFSSPAVVSLGCARIKSYLSLHRRPLSLPQSTPNSLPESLPQLHGVNDCSVAHAYWRKACQLERDLDELDEWLNTKISARLKNTMTREDRESPLGARLMRLSDGSYLREVEKVGRPWGRLVMQISSPTIAENSSTAAEVIGAMASMPIEDLHDCLTNSMQMDNLIRCNPGNLVTKNVILHTEDGFIEAIVLGAIERIERLVMEGLKIQMMCSNRRVAKDMEKENRARGKSCIVLVMLIQVRDPEEGYDAVGEPMVGLVEASVAEMEGRRYHIEGIHVAGIKGLSKRAGENNQMWSTSERGWKHYRNSD